MSSQKTMLHDLFSDAIGNYHAFASYLGFEVLEDGFIIQDLP